MAQVDERTNTAPGTPLDGLNAGDLASDADIDGEEQAHGALDRAETLRIVLVAAAAVLVAVGAWEPIPQVSLIGLLALVVGGWPIYKEALVNILERRMTMELSMSIAI